MRRLFPKIRLSWSAYRMWKEGDWAGLGQYFLEAEQTPSEAMIRGQEIHKQMEFIGVPKEVDDLSVKKNWDLEHKFEKPIGDYVFTGVIDALSDDVIVDYKTGGMSGYTDQVNIYNWIMGGGRTMYLVKIDDSLEVVKVQKTKLKEIDWESILIKMGDEIRDYFLKF